MPVFCSQEKKPLDHLILGKREKLYSFFKMCYCFEHFLCNWFYLFVTNIKCFCFLLISQALFCVSTVSHLLYRELWENYLFYVFVNSVKVLNMCMYRRVRVCPSFFNLCSRQIHVWLNNPLGTVEDSQGRECGLRALSSTVFPFLWLCGSGRVCQRPAVFSPGLHLSLSSRFGLFLLPVLLE